VNLCDRSGSGVAARLEAVGARIRCPGVGVVRSSQRQPQRRPLYRGGLRVYRFVRAPPMPFVAGASAAGATIGTGRNSRASAGGSWCWKASCRLMGIAVASQRVRPTACFELHRHLILLSGLRVRRDLEVRRDGASCERVFAADTFERERAARKERRAHRVGALSAVTDSSGASFEHHRHRILGVCRPGGPGAGRRRSGWAEGVVPTDGRSCSRACRRPQRSLTSNTPRSTGGSGLCACSGRSALRRPEVLAGVVARGFVAGDNRPSNSFKRGFAPSREAGCDGKRAQCTMRSGERESRGLREARAPTAAQLGH
jgi:hypothetical protein